LKPDTTKPSDPAKEQSTAFEQATAAFHGKDFGKAKTLFLEAAKGPAVELAHSAQMHIRMCERRLGAGQSEIKSPEEFYTLGISLINRGEYEGATKALESALQRQPDTDHYHYAMALCAGHRGDITQAALHLRKAIELQPANRIAALNDADFHTIAQQAPIRELLNSERSSNAG
jgi:tetratricopeptide (TPR) repeat protein